jgi:hypothetical protein
MGRIEEKFSKKQLTPDELELRGLAMQAVGALLLVFDSIPAVFVFVGIRDGSLMWLYWTVIEGSIGIALVAAGVRLKEKANDLLAHAAGPHLHATGEAGDREAA